MKAVILAGGAGTRLRHVIPDLPKPMAPVAGRPFLEYLIAHLAAGGLKDIVLSVGYRAEQIQSHFQNAWGGARISYAIEPEPLGTGGAIALAVRDAPGDEPVMVVNGDTFIGMDMADLVAWSKRALRQTSMAMVLCRVEDVARYGAVDHKDGVVTGFAEKGPAGPGLINGGCYLLRPALFKTYRLSGRFSFEADLLRPEIARLRPAAYLASGFFIDIGVPEDYARAQLEIPANAAAIKAMPWAPP